MMIKEINIRDRKTAEKIFALQQSAYRVEADLTGFPELPPLKESLDDLMNCGEQFLGFFAGDGILGAVSFKMTEEYIDIHRVMTDPRYFRKGIACRLLHYLEKNKANGKRLIVSTGAENRPAILLYEKLGFVKTSRETVEGGLVLQKFIKKPGACE